MLQSTHLFAVSGDSSRRTIRAHLSSLFSSISQGEGNDVDRPQLHPYLDLLHFRTLTIVATSEIARTGEVCDLFDSRIFIPSSSPASGPTVSIDLLVLRPIAVLLPLDDNTAELNRWYSIYKILNPKFVHIFGLPASPLDVPLGSSIPRFDFKDYIIWDQLEQLKITNAINNQDQLFFAHSLQHHAHPVVVFDLSSRWGVDLYELTLEEAALYEMNPETMGEGVKEWVLLMGSQSQKERCSQSLEVHWREDGMGDEEVAKARRKVRFEVVQ